MNAKAEIVGGIWALWSTYAPDIQDAVIRRLGKKATKKAKETAQSVWQRVDWKLSANRYREKVIDIYGTIRILGKPEPYRWKGFSLM